MEFLGNLGIDVKLLLAQIVNFGLLLWLLARFVYKPLIKVIEKDEAKMTQAQVLEKEMIQKEKRLNEQREREMALVKTRAREIIEEAENISKEIKSRVLKETEQEKQAVIKQIKSRLSDIENEKKSKTTNE